MLAWNSHIAALAHVCGAERGNPDSAPGYDIASVAGITGAAFRIALCEGATPPSLYLSWSHPHCFAEWLPALGVDAAVLWHPAGAPGAGCLLKRARELARQSLALGWPVVYWDHLAFSVIGGAAGERFASSGIARDRLHPALADPATAAPYLARLAGGEAAGPFELSLSLDELTGAVNGDLFFACPLGPVDADRPGALLDGVVRCARELAGQLEYPRRPVASGSSGGTRYGLPALERLVGELKQGWAHHFGLVQFIQSQAEGRRWGVQFLRRSAELLDPEFVPRVAQAAEFLGRASRGWNELARRWSLPLDPDAQLTQQALKHCAEELYQVHKTEETASRLLSSVADEVAH